jgi:hypothetical protein
MPTSVPVIEPKSDSLLQRLNTFVDKYVLPYPVMFLTNRVIILATLALLVPLLFYTSDQAFVNALNSYLNVMSVVVSSTVLLYATIADVRDRAAAKRAEVIAKAYEQLLEERVRGREGVAKAYAEELEERVRGREEIAKAYAEELEKRVQGREEIAKAYAEELEKRVQADHELIEQILQNSIENILGGRLEKIRVEDHKKLEGMQKALIASNETLRTELAEKALIASNEALRKEFAELRGLVEALYQRQIGKSTESGT